MDGKKLAKATVASLLAISATLPQNTEAADTAKSDYVKCYGVAAASKNDCGTKSTACAASVSTPGACYAWIYTPKDLCEKLANSSVGAPAAGCVEPGPKS